MKILQQMFQNHPVQAPVGMEKITETIALLTECAMACTICADACLKEDSVNQLSRCIRLNLDCAEICTVTGNLLIRQADPQPAVIRSMLQACMVACRACADECDRHASKHPHCRICAEACRQCEKTVARILPTLPAESTTRDAM